MHITRQSRINIRRDFDFDKKISGVCLNVRNLKLYDIKL
jgi:hypothetical protein